MLVCFLVAGILLGEIDSERFPLLTFHDEWQPTKQELVKLTSHNATCIHVTRPQVLANRSWKWWLTQQPRWLPEQAGNADRFEVFKVSTPPKFNIDTKNDGLEIYTVYILIISFQTWQLWVFQIWKGFQEDSQIFRGGKVKRSMIGEQKPTYLFWKGRLFFLDSGFLWKGAEFSGKVEPQQLIIHSLKVEPIGFWTSSFAGRV